MQYLFCYSFKGILTLKGLCHGCVLASSFATELEKILVIDKIAASCQANVSPTHYINRYKQQK